MNTIVMDTHTAFVPPDCPEYSLFDEWGLYPRLARAMAEAALSREFVQFLAAHPLDMTHEMTGSVTLRTTPGSGSGFEHEVFRWTKKDQLARELVGFAETRDKDFPPGYHPWKTAPGSTALWHPFCRPSHATILGSDITGISIDQEYIETVVELTINNTRRIFIRPPLSDFDLLRERRPGHAVSLSLTGRDFHWHLVLTSNEADKLTEILGEHDARH